MDLCTFLFFSPAIDFVLKAAFSMARLGLMILVATVWWKILGLV